MNEAELLNQFVQNASRVDAGVTVVESDETLQKVINALVPAGGSVYCAGSTVKERTAALPPEVLTSDYQSASVAVEEVPAAIAETGSIVCWSREARPVQASLLPPHHIAIVSRGNIFRDLDHFFNSVGDSPPTNITLITGPSRTADIELTLTIGVHGPERLDIIVY